MHRTVVRDESVMCTQASVSTPDSPWLTLQAVSIVQFLNHDKRPTFIVDAQQTPTNFAQQISVTFTNEALRAQNTLLNIVNSLQSVCLPNRTTDYQAFSSWISSLDEDGSGSEFTYAGFVWSRTTLEARWNVLGTRTQDNCTCTTRDIGPQLEPTSTTPPPTMCYIMPSIRHEDNAPISHQSRPGIETAHPIDKDLTLLMKAQNFFVEELLGTERWGNSKIAQELSAIDHTVDPSDKSSNDFIQDVKSTVFVAKRNASLLAKVSAFDAFGIAMANNDGEIVFANDAWYRICGLPRGPVDAQTWMSIFEDAEVPKIAEIWKDITMKRETTHFDTSLKRRWVSPISPDPGPVDFPVWLSVWAYPDVSVDGETIGCCSLITDISEQKRADLIIEQQLADAVERTKVLEQLSKNLEMTEARFRRISDLMPHGIFVCNVSGNMLYTNDAYREVFPSSSDPSMPEPWWNNIPEEERNRAMEVWRKIREENVKVSFEISFPKSGEPLDTSTGERRYMAISAYPELHENREIKHITGCITDISHLKIAEKTQGARADDAEASKRNLEHFIDMTSHEIRNPLSAVLHSAEEVLLTLRSNPQGVPADKIPNATETLETIIDCTNHSTRIVDDILVVSKLDSGLLNIAPSTVQLATAIEQTLRMFEGEMKAADITRSFTVDPSFELFKLDWLSLDINRVRQILVNLITNAIKFTRPEKVRRIDTEVRASLQMPISNPSQDEPQLLPTRTKASASYLDDMNNEEDIVYVIISVTDSGCGMSVDEQKNLWKRFSQAGKRTHVKYGGTGLGLYISRQLCEMQGGQIGFHSQTGKGSVFKFYIKALRSSPPTIQAPQCSSLGLRFGNPQTQLSSRRAVTGSAHEKRTPFSLLHRTILLVEDNLVNQKVVAKMLRNQQYTVLVANDGVEALDIIKSSALFSGALMSAPPISVVLLDVEMPVMDGLTCVRRIRRMEASGELRCHVPVIAITANARQEQIDQAQEAGMDDVVTKPFRMEKLLTAINQLGQQHPTY